MSSVPAEALAAADPRHSALLLAVAGAILGARESDAALSHRVFEMIRGPLRADVLFNYRLGDDGALHLVASAGLDAAQSAQAARLALGQAFCGTAAACRAPLAADAQRIGSDPAGAFVREMGVKAYACHPLFGRDGQVLGTFSIGSRQRRSFGAAEVDFLQTVSHFLAMAWDRSQAEATLAAVTIASERRRRLYETILANTPDLAYVFDLGHRFIYANEGLLAMWGRSWDEAIGRNCLELGYPDWHAEMHDREIEQVKATKAPIRGQVPFNGTFGRRIYDYIFVPVLGPDGEVEAVAGTTRDITELKQAQDRLLEQDHRKDEFLATLAHELRNPLAPVRTGLRILGMDPGPELAARTRETMGRQVAHMVRLIDDLLDVARITTGKMQLHPEHVDLREAVQGGLDVARPALEAARHTLSVSLPASPVQLEADPIRIAQAVSNLLHNAAKYTPPEGRVELSLACEDGVAVIRVRDNGAGLAPESLPGLFELFTQAGKTLDRAQGGLGIGLALVKRVVEMHGGGVEAASDGLGQGATFTIRLPLGAAAAPADTAQSAPAATELPAVPASRDVLVVDDNVDAAETLVLVLELDGHIARMAHSGEAALQRVAERRPEVVFLDIGMPGMDGYAVARRLREQWPGVPMLLVALTGWGNVEDRRKAEAAGFDLHLTKPVDAAQLQALLRDPRRPAG
jgi:PAS domain S-box-containing protein